MTIMATHVVLAVFLFLITNWIGKHSISVGYMQLSVVAKADDAPAFNFIFRTLSPVVYIVLVSAFSYWFNVEWITTDIYLVAVYYFLFRALFNVLTGRLLLINWLTQAVYWVTSISASYFVYLYLISDKNFLFPSREDLGSVLWLAILAFLYATFNKVNLPHKRTLQRKKRYLENRFAKFHSQYQKIIDDIVESQEQEVLAYAILIYENFNRPKIYRLIERLAFGLGIVKTLGVMQVESDKRISDEESVRLGCKKIVNDYKISERKIDEESRALGWNRHRSYRIRQEVIAMYNRDDSYVSEIDQILRNLAAEHYPQLQEQWAKESRDQSPHRAS